MYYLQFALKYFELMKFNVLPLRGKIPSINWKEWQNKFQNKADIEAMEWINSSGVGAIMGINNLRCIDLDIVEDPDIIETILQELGLPEDYRWVVQSGSGEGFHIYFLCEEPSPQPSSRIEFGTGSLPEGEGISSTDFYKKLGGQKSAYKFYLKQEGVCHHLELRWKECQTALPPSMHESGGVYSFFNNEPMETPATIEAEKVASFIDKYCKTGRQAEIEKTEEKTIYFDEEKLESAVEYLSKNLPEGTYDDWITIGFGLASLGKRGEEYFVKMSLANPNYKDSESEVRVKFTGLLNDYDGSTTIKAVYRIAENYGWKKPVIRFWYVDDRGQVKISRPKFKRFLESEGYGKLKKDGGHLFVRIVNNIVTEIDTIQVKDFVLNYLYTLSIEEFEGISRSQIIDALMKGATVFFANQFFEFLITRNVIFKRDAAYESFLFFQNGYVSVTKNSVQLVDYKDMTGNIWEKQIIEREYAPVLLRSDYEDFLHNICRKNVQRTKALMSGIGYLLHNFRDPNNAKAVIFIDEKKSEGAYGRSGKGLVIKAVSKIRTVIIEDGRNFNIGKNFAFQRVNADTNIVAIEDMREKFPFDRLFSIITEGLTIEKKNVVEIFIPFPESPKIVISSNFTIQGVDDSTWDRQFIVEFSDHYNKRNRPIDEFGKLFFDGWTVNEWRAFDNFMIQCIQLYLKEGLVTYEYVNLEQKQLIDETCDEFAEYCSSIELNHEYNKKELFDNFKNDYPDFEKLTQSKFTRWLKLWARIKDYEVVEGKSGANRTIIFSEIKKAA
ncbi:MAG: hypothetical protein B6D44_16315 [Ignavibacteriales bacterium UTCHB2]|nr:bifunctional DNA primase/polymerase [Ignavibacteria bacterium]OQY70175.1 MAG: hypothetical protein B6D44_16315 [Ignavibacteriales bacterium UTCHB2]